MPGSLLAQGVFLKESPNFHPPHPAQGPHPQDEYSETDEDEDEILEK